MSRSEKKQLPHSETAPQRPELGLQLGVFIRSTDEYTPVDSNLLHSDISRYFNMTLWDHSPLFDLCLFGSREKTA